MAGNHRKWPEVVISGLPIVVIGLAIVANLASVATKISVEKDWVVAIAADDKDFLAKMNSTLRTVDLLCLLVAPLLAGIVFDQGPVLVWHRLYEPPYLFGDRLK